jgi:uncharacterized protein (TIGR03086 family)
VSENEGGVRLVPDHRSSLLETAVHYGLSSFDAVTPSALCAPTPCPDWDLAALLSHLSQSLSTLREGACEGRIELVPPASGRPPACDTVVVGRADDLAPDLRIVADLRRVTAALLRDWRQISLSDRHFTIGDLPLAIAVVEVVAAIEIAVHGWDIFESCDSPSPIPEHLARDLLRASALVVDETVRPALFGAPIEIDASGSASDRLVAFFGRRPRRHDVQAETRP